MMKNNSKKGFVWYELLLWVLVIVGIIFTVYIFISSSKGIDLQIFALGEQIPK